jgi:hypothetical protein
VITAEELRRSPSWFPLELAGPESVRLVRLDEPAYRAASFLDRRILAAEPQQAMCDPDVLREAAAGLAPRLHYIFHIGHVGSTLVSRLVGEHPRFFSLREPALLRELAPGGALAAAEAALATVERGAGALGLEVLLRLLARTWRSEQRAVIKATSFLSELAPEILASSEQPAAVLVYAQPAAYLRGILGGPNSRVEAQRLAASRLERLVRRLGPGEWQAQLASEGEYLAMSWLCEMTALDQAAGRPSASGDPAHGPVLWIDFDAFLADPAPGLTEIVRTLGGSPGAREIEALVSGPLMRRYSKAPEHPYDAQLRGEVLAMADRQYGTEVRRGMDWLQGAAARHPIVAGILERTEPRRQASPGLPPH